MIPFGFRAFRTPPTKLYLNGPELEFTLQPQDAASNVGGIATFTASSRGFFRDNLNGTVDGRITYQWYDDDGALSDSSKIVGSATSSLTIKNIQSPTDNRNLYVQATYVPGKYGEQTEYSKYRTSGKAINSPLNSNTASLYVAPVITITTQPVSQTVGQDEFATFTAAATISDTQFPLQYFWTLDGVTIPNSNSTTISIKSSIVGTEKVRFYAFANLGTARIQEASNEVDLIGVAPRSIIKFEAFASDNSYTSFETNLDDGSFTLNDTIFSSSYNIVTFYAKEKSFNLSLNLSAARGVDNGSFTGGQGGKSTITLTLTEDTEYTMLGITNNSAIYLYKGSELLAVVGQGGNAGTTSNGGAGGGIGLSGANGAGLNGGTGGSRILPGDLSLIGVFGSVLSGASINLYPGDTIATAPKSGRAISCSRGRYWINLGISACSNNSTSPIKFVNTTNTQITASDSIIRGFKPGYTVTTTAGLGVNNGGNGGNGATGGQGGTSGAGGGGGSGYTNGIVNVVSATLGGNSSTKSSAVFSVV